MEFAAASAGRQFNGRAEEAARVAGTRRRDALQTHITGYLPSTITTLPCSFLPVRIYIASISIR